MPEPDLVTCPACNGTRTQTHGWAHPCSLCMIPGREWDDTGKVTPEQAAAWKAAEAKRMLEAPDREEPVLSNFDMSNLGGIARRPGESDSELRARIAQSPLAVRLTELAGHRQAPSSGE